MNQVHQAHVCRGLKKRESLIRNEIFSILHMIQTKEGKNLSSTRSQAEPSQSTPTYVDVRDQSNHGKAEHWATVRFVVMPTAYCSTASHILNY